MAKPRLVTSLLTGLLFAVGAVGTIDAQRIQDIARVEGVRNRQLKGYGLVLGLPGTGDNSRNLLTRKLYQGLLKNLDIDLSEDSIKSKNVAVVMVTATVSSWMKTGAEFDVVVSSIGDAKSIKDGILLEVRLHKPGASSLGDEEFETVALAQGRVVVEAAAGTTGKCTATVEQDISFPLHDGRADRFRILLNRPDFSAASSVARAINEFPWLRRVAKNEMPLAHAEDLGSVQVRVPKAFQTDKKFIDFVSRIMTDVRLDAFEAKVVIDETGLLPTVVINGRVRVKPIVILYKDLEIRVGAPKRSERETKVPSEGHPLLIDVMDGLKQNGLGTADLPEIIRKIDEAGALVGRIETVREKQQP